MIPFKTNQKIFNFTQLVTKIIIVLLQKDITTLNMPQEPGQIDEYEEEI